MQKMYNQTISHHKAEVAAAKMNSFDVSEEAPAPEAQAKRASTRLSVAAKAVKIATTIQSTAGQKRMTII